MFPLANELRLASEAVFPLSGFDRFRRDFRYRELSGAVLLQAAARQAELRIIAQRSSA